ncbi:MAG TPA: TIGR03808 family TAT-translocated repetitive protein [Pseudolabrys sp.]|nr:TIGR03808 family TAT-translocated repetitive protein [Pseudolabrys sp.]
MPMDRRSLLIGSLSGAAALTVPLSAYGIDAAQFGVRPGAPDDQSRALQRAISQAARTRAPLMLAPGVYRTGDLKLPAGAQLFGVRGATRLLLTRGPSLLSGEGGDHITISGLVLDGVGQPLPQNRGLVHLVASKSIRIVDCEFSGAGGNAIALERCEGRVTANSITGAADNAIFCNDNFGVTISSNTIRDSGNGGIRVWQSVKRHDGSIVADNTIDDTEARAGGTGENGNAINVFRAANVIVRNNIIRRAAFSAIRGNAAANIQIIGNNCASLKETALYSEFDFEGAIVANNVVDTAENGISVTNFNNGGRLATVHGNLIRNIGVQRPGTSPEDAGIGIGIEAETAVTGNVVESAAHIGIRAGWGPYLRNVTISGNVVRNAAIGIAVSVAPKAGDAIVSGNIIAGAQLGAVVAMEWSKVVSGDLAKEGAARYPQLAIDNNQTR